MADPILERLTRLTRLLQADERDIADLQPVQFQVLRYLASCNRFSDRPAAVAEYLGVTKGTASQTINVLGARGYVRKYDDAADGRRVRLAMTPKGRQVLRRAGSDSLITNAIDALDADERRELEASLARLTRAVQAAGGGRSFGACGTCRHHRGGDAGTYCALLEEPLSDADARKICREHEHAARSSGAPEGVPLDHD